MDKKKKEKSNEEAPIQTEENVAAQTPEQPKCECASKEKDTESEQSVKESETEKLRAEAEDFKRKWYLVTAEYDNYRKRTANESAKRYCEGRADVVSKLFPIADSLEFALASCVDEATKKGIAMVKSSFEALLKEEKIETIDPLGQPFDAHLCEAIMAVDPQGEEESGTVKQVYRKGYLQNGKVLRYAQVVVIK